MSELEKLLEDKYGPIAIYRIAEPPSHVKPCEKKHCFVESLFLPAMQERKSVYADFSLLGCGGPPSGLCFGGGKDKDLLAEAYSVRNGYFDTPERVWSNYLNLMEDMGSTEGCIVFEPLDVALEHSITPDVVVFFPDTLHLCALMVMAGYARDSTDPPAVMRYALACEQLYLLPMIENRKENPQAIIGMTEFFTRRLVDPDRLAFSVPYKMFLEMDKNANESFLSKGRWNKK